MSDSEKQPLIGGDNPEVIDHETPEPENKRVPRRYFLVAPVAFLHIFSYALTQITMTQYGYAAIYEMRYPDEIEEGTSGEQVTTCGVNTTNYLYIHQQEVQAETSLWNIYCALAAFGPAILANLLMGPLSDKFGRKDIFIITLVGTFGRALGSALGIYYEINIYTFIVFYFIEGIGGMWMCSLNNSHSYVADVTGSGQQRSFGMALIEINLGFGLTAGTLVSGYIISGLGFQYPMIFSCGCTILALIIAAFVLPESVKNTNKKQNQQQQQQTLGSTIQNTIRFYTDKSTNRWRYIVCICVIFLVALSNTGRTSVDTLYELNSPFCWDSVLIGWYATLKSVSHVVIGIGSVRLFQFCLSDEVIAMIGSISFIGSAIQEALASTDVVLFLVNLTGAGSIMSAPMIRGIMSRMTPSNKQGAMFAGIAAVEAICALVGAISANAIYAGTVNFFRGFVFLVLGGYNVIVLIFLVILKVGQSANAYARDGVEIIVDRKQSIKPAHAKESSLTETKSTSLSLTKSHGDIMTARYDRI